MIRALKRLFNKRPRMIEIPHPELKPGEKIKYQIAGCNDLQIAYVSRITITTSLEPRKQKFGGWTWRIVDVPNKHMVYATPQKGAGAERTLFANQVLRLVPGSE